MNSYWMYLRNHKRKRSTSDSECRIKRSCCKDTDKSIIGTIRQRCFVFFLLLLFATAASATDTTFTAFDHTVSKTETKSHKYNTKHVGPYLSQILQKGDDNSISRKLQKDDIKVKDDDKNKVPTTPVPTRSPSRSPTVSPTASPTRAPVIVPWMNLTKGKIELKVSIFTYENMQVAQQQETTNTRRKLNRLSAAEILDNSHNDLIEIVLSSMATILCDNEEGINILTVVNMTFYDYCGMLLHDDRGTIADSSIDFEVNTNALSSNQTYLVTDLVDEDTGLLNIEDRRVFISNLSSDNRNDGDYLSWTVWSVSYPILQFGMLLGESQQTNVTSTMEEVQATFDRLFSTAVTNGVMDELLQQKNKDDILVASLEGWEVETFVNALERLEGASSNNSEREGLTPKEHVYVFWQPIRIAGFVILGVLLLTVGLLMKVGHERYKYDAWDAAVANDKRQKEQQQLLQEQQQALNVDISTCEGLDFMLHCSHQARKQSAALVRPSPSGQINDVSESDGVLPMNMGNTLSEIVGPPVEGDGAGPQMDSSTPRPSPAKVMRSSLLKSLVGLDRYKDFNDAECIGNGDQYALVSVKTKTNRSSFLDSSTKLSSKPLFPPSLNSASSSSFEDELLFQNQHQKSEKTPLKIESRQRNSSSQPMTMSTPKRNSNGSKVDVATPENAQRIRFRDSDEYAFISVSSKNQKH